MSRVGNNPITVPSGVTVEIAGSKLAVNGSKGKLEMDLLPEVIVEQKDNQIIVKRKNELKLYSKEYDQKFSKAAHGLTRALINNMVLGVSEGWERKLEMVGVGYRAQGGGDTVTLSVGFSHPVTVKAPEGVSFAVIDNTKITVTGIDKTLVGQIAANIRSE